MGKDLPEFKRQVGIQPAGAVDVQGRLDTLSNVLDQFSQRSLAAGQKVADIRAEQAGAEAGVTPGFKGKLAPGITEVTRAFNQAALASNKMQNQVTIRNDIQSISDNITNPATFGVGATAQFDAQVQALGEAFLPNVPKQNLQVAQNIFQFEAGNARRAISRKEGVLKQNIVLGAFREAIISNGTESGNTAHNGDLTAALGIHGQTAQNINAGVEGGIISKGDGKTLNENSRQNIQNHNILGGFERALNAGVGDQYIKDFEKSKLPEAPEDKAQLTAQMLGMEANHGQSALMRQKSIQDKLQQQNTALQLGLHVDPVLLAQFKNEHPAEWVQMQAKLIFSKLYGSTMQAMRFLGVNERNVAIQTLAQNVREEPNNFNKQRLLDAVHRGSNQQLKAVLDDPHGYVQSSPAVQNALSARQIAVAARAQAGPFGRAIETITPQGTFDVGRLMWPTIDAAKLAPLSIDPIQVSLNMQADMGVPPEDRSVMSKAAASEFVTQLKNLPLDQQIQQVQGVLLDPNTGFGEHADIALRDFNKAHLGFAHQYILSAAHDPAVRALIPEMVAAKEQDVKQRKNTLEVALDRANLGLAKGSSNLTTKADIRSEVVNNLQDYTASLGSGNTPTSQLQAQVTDEVQEGTTYLMANKGESLQQAAKDAADFVVNHNFQYVSQANSNIPLRVAAGRDKEQIFAAGNNLKAQALTEDLQIPQSYKNGFPGVPQSRLEEIYKDNIQRDSYLISNPGTNAIILVDPQGRTILTQKGNQIEATYAQIDNPTDPLYQFIPPVSERLLQEGVLPGGVRGLEQLEQTGEIVSPIASLREGEVGKTIESFGRQVAAIKGISGTMDHVFTQLALKNLIKTK